VLGCRLSVFVNHSRKSNSCHSERSEESF